MIGILCLGRTLFFLSLRGFVERFGVWIVDDLFPLVLVPDTEGDAPVDRTLIAALFGNRQEPAVRVGEHRAVAAGITEAYKDALFLC